MGMAQDTGQVYALLADGTTVEIRPAGPDDFDAVLAMHEAMAPDNVLPALLQLQPALGRDRGPPDLHRSRPRYAGRRGAAGAARW